MNCLYPLFGQKQGLLQFMNHNKSQKIAKKEEIMNVNVHYVRIINICGERGIRTLGTGFPVRQFSKLFLSATQASLRILFLRTANVEKDSLFQNKKCVFH